LVHSKAVRRPLVAIIRSNLKCMFCSRTISQSVTQGGGARGSKPARPAPSKSPNGSDVYVCLRCQMSHVCEQLGTQDDSRMQGIFQDFEHGVSTNRWGSSSLSFPPFPFLPFPLLFSSPFPFFLPFLTSSPPLP